MASNGSGAASINLVVREEAMICYPLSAYQEIDKQVDA